MKLAYTMSEQPGKTDETLADLAATLKARGVKLAGLVQTNSENCDHHRCDMDVQILPAGEVIRISQSLGRGAKGCRLDPGALEQAVQAVYATLDEQVDLLVVNKFGKHEAEGRGFRPLIAEALAHGIPVILGVGKLSQTEFLEFAGGAAEFVEPDAAALLAWLFENAKPRSACA